MTCDRRLLAAALQRAAPFAVAAVEQQQRRAVGAAHDVTQVVDLRLARAALRCRGRGRGRRTGARGSWSLADHALHDAAMTAERTTGFTDINQQHWSLRYLPPWARPYGRLARWDRPIGIWLLMLPCWWSAALGAAPEWGRLIGWMALFGARRARHARRGLHLERHRRPQGRCPGRAHAQPAAAGGRGEAAQRADLDGAAVGRRARRSCSSSTSSPAAWRCCRWSWSPSIRR